jgi:glutathione peroxidase
VKVKGSDKHPLYDWLLSASSQKDQLGEVKWNFQKFLIDENGEHVKTIEPTVEPMDEEILNWINE